MADDLGGLRERLQIRPWVLDALADGKPIVALESTLISHGFAYPANREVALAAEDEVRVAGAVPATIAIHGGQVLVGLTADEVEALATATGVLKAARPSLAAALAGGGWASTTVSATMLASAAAGIRVFATGGIGGVHRGALGATRGYAAVESNVSIGSGGIRGAGLTPATFDISADVDELGRTPVAVVCAGPKLILDIGLTMEALETRGVPVLTIGVPEVPGFWCRGSGVPSPRIAADEDEAARIVGMQLSLGLGSGILVCAPVPVADAVPRETVEREIEAAIEEASRGGIHGASLTPWLLARLAERTNGATVAANKSLIRNNAATAARIAGRIGAA